MIHLFLIPSFANSLSSMLCLKITCKSYSIASWHRTKAKHNLICNWACKRGKIYQTISSQREAINLLVEINSFCLVFSFISYKNLIGMKVDVKIYILPVHYSIRSCLIANHIRLAEKNHTSLSNHCDEN